MAETELLPAIKHATRLLGRTIDSAPKDGTPFQARIPGHGDDNIIAWTGGLQDSNDRSCGGWQFVEEQEPPDCWTGGICWEVNEDGKPSVQPTHWQPLPSPPVPEQEGASEGEGEKP